MNLRTLELRRWKTVMLFSIVVPMSLLVTFRISGILREPMTWETVSLDPVSWSMNRPSNTRITDIDEWVKNFYNDSSVSVNFEIHLLHYHENDLEYGDYIDLRLTLAVNIADGFVDSVVIRHSLAGECWLEIEPHHNRIKLENLQLKKIQHGDQPYIYATGMNRPEFCSLSNLARWLFDDNENIDNSMRATAEILYFNGTAYQKIHVPIDHLFVAVQTS